MTEKTIVLIYEPEQVSTVVAYVKNTPGAEVVAINYWIESALAAQGVQAHSLVEFVPEWSSFDAELNDVEDAAREWYRQPEMSFFTHRNLLLGEVVEVALYTYMQQCRAYVLLLKKILEKYPAATALVVPHTTKNSSATAGPFAKFEEGAVPAVAEYVAKERGIPFRTIGVSQSAEVILFPQQSLTRAMLLRIYNFGVSWMPRRRIKILVSDHWRNIKAIVEKMDDAELIFVDRKEFQHIPLWRLLKHRIRFIHPLDRISSSIRRLAYARTEAYPPAWKEARAALARMPEFKGEMSSVLAIIEPALEYVVCTYATRIIADIEALASVMEQENINRTLLRASVSGQHHFFILGELPRQSGVPSLEIQHGIGLGTIRPHSVFGRMYVDYLATYGPVITEAFIRAGYARERVPPLGSPRFDRYFSERDAVTAADKDSRLRALGLDPKKPIVLIPMPAEDTGFQLGSIDLTSYELRDYLRSLQTLKHALPEIQYLFKFRSEQHRSMYQVFLEELFPGEKLCMEYGDLFHFALLSDIVVSSFSTAVVECLMARKPVVLYPLKAGESAFYEVHKEGVVSVPLLDTHRGIPQDALTTSVQTLLRDPVAYKAAVTKGERFLGTHFTFTGDAAARVADFIRTVPASN